jgi:hypothetical protein
MNLNSNPIVMNHDLISIALSDHEENISMIANEVGACWHELHDKLGDSMGVMRLAVDWAYEFIPIHKRLMDTDKIDDWIEVVESFVVDKINEVVNE